MFDKIILTSGPTQGTFYVFLTKTLRKIVDSSRIQTRIVEGEHDDAWNPQSIKTIGFTVKLNCKK